MSLSGFWVFGILSIRDFERSGFCFFGLLLLSPSYHSFSNVFLDDPPYQGHPTQRKLFSWSQVKLSSQKLIKVLSDLLSKYWKNDQNFKIISLNFHLSLGYSLDAPTLYIKFDYLLINSWMKFSKNSRILL